MHERNILIQVDFVDYLKRVSILESVSSIEKSEYIKVELVRVVVSAAEPRLVL
jgi:hypothetical protein